MEEEEALRNHCGRMISLVRSKQQHLQSPEEEEWRRRRRGARHTHKGGKGRERAEFRDDRENTKRGGDRASLDLKSCQGPESRPVPVRLISLLRLKSFEERIKPAAEVELHDPAVCAACEQRRASLALRSFIRRKKTQLQFQTLKGRLNTRWSCGECEHKGSLFKFSQSTSTMPLAGFGRNYLVDTCRSQQPGVALATTKERGVALATDEMRGYPDKNATGTHLARPRCPFSDR